MPRAAEAAWVRGPGRLRAQLSRRGISADFIRAGQIGGQALRLGLIDEVVVHLVPAVFGSGRPFFATGRMDGPILLDNPSQVVRGYRVTHLVYDVMKR
jgi:dihydrofolate reductase